MFYSILIFEKKIQRFKELRSYFATSLRNNGVLADYVDLLQGRTFFAMHHLKVENVKELVLLPPLLRIVCSDNNYP